MTTKPIQKSFLLGVDTGSSKTHAIVSDLSGKVLGVGEAGCGNYEIVGESGFADVLHAASKEALVSSGIEKREISAMGFGICGYDWPSEKSIMVNAINSLGIDCPYRYVNDVTLGLIAGSSSGWGIAADAGTGNNVRGLDKSGNIGRITGNGLRFGEFGGASELVWRGMIAATYAWSSRGSKTGITQLLMNYAEVNSEDALIEGLAMGNIHLSPTLAENIIQLATEGDAEAKKAVDFNARELAVNVNAVVRQLNFQAINFEIVMIGSVFNAGEIYTKPFTDTILHFAPRADFVRLTAPPVVGSILIGAEILNVKTKEFKTTLVDSVKKIFS